MVDVRTLTCVGLGAGGGATAFALASTQNLCGHINLVDPDEIEDSNLNRYVFAGEQDAQGGRHKTAVLAEIFSIFSEVNAHSFPVPFEEVKDLDYRYVAAAVHTRQARRDIQDETPYVMWDAGAAEDGEFRLWRMDFGYSECMWCKHPPSVGDPDIKSSQQLSEVLGLSKEEWLSKLKNNGKFTTDEISQMRRPDDALWLLPQEGERFGEWYAGQCGKLRLDGFDQEVPMPFAPVMAGILVAGEIVKEHLFSNNVLDSYYWNTLLGRFMKRNKPRHRGPSADCRLCDDADFREQYERRWGISVDHRCEQLRSHLGMA